MRRIRYIIMAALRGMIATAGVAALLVACYLLFSAIRRMAKGEWLTGDVLGPRAGNLGGLVIIGVFLIGVEMIVTMNNWDDISIKTRVLNAAFGLPIFGVLILSPWFITAEGIVSARLIVGSAVALVLAFAVKFLRHASEGDKSGSGGPHPWDAH